MEFAAELRRALAAAGMNQSQLSAAMPFSRPKISEMCNGHYLPSDETARRMIEVLAMDEDRTLRLLREARASRSALAEPRWSQPLPPEIGSLLRAQVSAADVLPYKLPGSRPVSLSTLYVRQDLGSGIEETPASERMPDPMPQADDRDPGWRPRNPERFRPLLGVRPPSRPIREALDEHDHLLVTGGPGQGKSTLALRLSADIASAWNGAAPPVTEPVIPLRLPARELAARLNLPFADALAQSVLAEYGQMLRASPAPGLFAGRVEGCRWLLLVDAIDEVADASDRDSLINNLARWAVEDIYRFLVTSRPLEGAGLAPLHRAAAARYELLPFDTAALRRFAENWFGQGESSHRFLDQVKQGQLEDLIQVPLLATIAAIVFDQYHDSSLPDNKYGLYQDYLEYLGSARVHPDMRDLLEHLGLTRVETDAPLIPTAETWAQRSPDLVPNLLATGVLVMRAGKLQFLHHSFAEHLAATAKARRLPVPFDPEDPLWREALHATRYGWATDHARDVLVHYTYLHRSQADALFEWLHDNTADQQQVAAELLAQRVPVGADVVKSFLDTVWSWAKTTAYRAEKILERAARAAPTEWLQALANESEAPWESRIEAASVLSTRSAQAVELLSHVTWSAQLPLPVRLAAARSLAKAGTAQHKAAADGLAAILADPSIADRDRRAAAVALADLGGDCRAHAVECLLSTVNDPTTAVGHLVHAAAGLAEIGIEFHDQVVAVFQRVVQDDTLDPSRRQDAALALGALGPVYAQAAAAVLERLATSRETVVLFYADLAATIGKLGPEYVPVAARVLAELAADPWVLDHYKRMSCAIELGKLGGAYRQAALEHLRYVLRDPTASANHRVWAARGLAQLGPEYHEEAAAQLRKQAADPVASGFDRWNPLEELAGLSPRYREAAVADLLAALDDQSLAADDRVSAAAALTALGPEFHGKAIENYRMVMSELSATWRIVHVQAAERLLQYSPGHRDEVVTALRDMACSPLADRYVRVDAPVQLARLGPEFRQEAAAFLQAAASGDLTIRALRQLIEIGREYHPMAAELLCAMVMGPRTPGWSVESAAKDLAGLGTEYRAKAVGLLRKIIADPCSFVRRIHAATALADFGEDYQAEAAVTLREVITDPGVDPDDRREAATKLAQCGSEYRAEAVAALESLAERHEDDPWGHAIEALAHIDDESRARAVRVLRKALSGDDPDRSRSAARYLPRLDRRFLPEAIGELGRQTTDPAIDSGSRIEAAWGLVCLDPATVDLATGYFSDLLADETADLDSRCRAAGHLVHLDRDRWQDVGSLLTRLRGSQLTTPDEQVSFLRALERINVITRGPQVEAMWSIAMDPSTPPDVRWSVFTSLRNEQFMPEPMVAQLCRDLAADGMAPPRCRGEDKTMLADVTTGPEFDHATKVAALKELADVPTLLSGRALRTLGSINARCRVTAIEAARAIVHDPAEPLSERWKAAVTLDELRAEPDEATVQIFTGVLGEPSCRSVRAAAALGRVDTLRRLVNSDTHVYIRAVAAKTLIAVSPVDRPMAVVTLDAMAAGSWRVAETLAEVAPECRSKAVQHLKRIMTTTPPARIEAARVVVRIDRTTINDAARALRDVAKDPRYARRALFALGQLARPFCDEALPGLRALMRQPDHTVRWRAAEAMAILRRDLREEASVVAREVARDETAPWHVRLKAAAGLAKWSLICRDEARAILLDVGLSQRPT